MKTSIQRLVTLLAFVFCLTLAASAQRAPTLQIIDGPRVEGVGDTWAVIAWTTNTGGSSIIRYGTDGNSLRQTAMSPYADDESRSRQTHRVKVENLRPATRYYFIADSGQGEGTGTEARSSVMQFDTRGEGRGNGRAALQIVDGPRIEGVGRDSAVIAWTTSMGGSSIIRYGTDPNGLTQTAMAPYANDPKRERSVHRVNVNNLRPGTTYYFIADSGQGEGTGTEVKSQIMQFTTKGDDRGRNGARGHDRAEALRIIDGPRVEGVGNDWAVIAWTTNTGGSTIVRYGTNANSMRQTAEAPYADNESREQQTHRVQVKNLQPNTTYYFMVDSGQGEGTGTEARSSVATFTTKRR